MTGERTTQWSAGPTLACAYTAAVIIGAALVGGSAALMVVCSCGLQVSYMDGVVGNITSEIKARGIWEHTLVVWSSDNGGAVHLGGGANNYPLRGGYYNKLVLQKSGSASRF